MWLRFIDKNYKIKCFEKLLIRIFRGFGFVCLRKLVVFLKIKKKIFKKLVSYLKNNIIINLFFYLGKIL